MFKSWKLFVFSLVPLGLIFTGVFIGSIHGSDSDPEVLPTPGAARPPSSSSPPAGAPPGTTVLQITAANLTFSPRTLTAPANSPVTVRMNNQDAGVLHNFAVYTNSQATTKVFMGELNTGPDTKDYSFTTPAAGAYFFRCDVHPDTMTGTFTVR
jgi:plastocyanin